MKHEYVQHQIVGNILKACGEMLIFYAVWSRRSRKFSA